MLNLAGQCRSDGGIWRETGRCCKKEDFKDYVPGRGLQKPAFSFVHCLLVPLSSDLCVAWGRSVSGGVREP